MGAVTVVKVKELGHWVWSAGKRAKLVKFTFSNSYATGGDTVDIANLGFKRVQLVLPLNGTPDIGGYTVPAQSTGGYKYELGGTEVAPKVKVTKGAGSPAEETNATDLSAQNFYAIVVGDSG